MLLVIMLNCSRFVYSVLHSLLSLFAFSLDHLTTTYAVSSRTARPNRSSLYHFCIFDGDGRPYSRTNTESNINMNMASQTKRASWQKN